jgi:hypothetical protein
VAEPPQGPWGLATLCQPLRVALKLPLAKMGVANHPFFFKKKKKNLLNNILLLIFLLVGQVSHLWL